jgi:multidrug efflux pump subunit AcrA (membrane-fusion protein)
MYAKKLLVARYVVVFALGIFVAWFAWGRGDSVPGEDSAEASEAEGPTTWTCSMHPQIRLPKPGKCPICRMDLIPVAKTSGGMRTLTVSPAAKALMNIETAPVERRYVTHTIPMVGKVDYDETKLGYITAWFPGRLDRLYVDYTGVEVKKGDHMVYIYSEQLYTAQQGLIDAVKSARARGNKPDFFNTGGIDLVESSREKLRLLGLTPKQIAGIEKLEKPSDHLTIYAPVGGIVIEKLKKNGERVALGDRIYTIADLRQVWVHLDAYETDLPWIHYGQNVTVTTESYPGEEFHGRIAFIQKFLNDKTRTVKVRVNVPNTKGKLKPGMFVHATVRPKVAAGGRVMDAGLAGKWISPMHPEIIKDEPGTCDICGMPLVRAESLGYVTPETDALQPPLVIPYLAALVTGTRAVVYVELPSMHSTAEPAFQTLSTVIEDGKRDKIREAFATYARMLDMPYDHPGTVYAKGLWNEYADRFGKDALAGQRVQNKTAAEKVLARIETTLSEAREQFASAGQPTFEGREIVLGPRAGKYYLVRNGLDEGELVVTNGNFKIDAEIQIQAKPSMMTPAGGRGGGHEHAGQKLVLPSEFYGQIRDLEAAYEIVATSVEQRDAAKVTTSFSTFGRAVVAVDGSLLTGHPRMLWKEFGMLLGNDAVEGSDVTQPAEADRIFLLLKGHMRRMREQLDVAHEPAQEIERIAVAAAFQAELAKIWRAYLPIQQALATDDFAKARKSMVQVDSALRGINEKSLTGRAQQVWKTERKNLTKLLTRMQAAKNITTLRAAFKPLSEEIGVLAKTFGFGKPLPVYELHCPMAFQGKGAIWYQENDRTNNPYFGSTMLKCADRVEQIMNDELPRQNDRHKDH